MPTRPPIHRPVGWSAEQRARQQQQQDRPSSYRRGYDSAWRKTREAFLAVNPWCCVPGCTERASHVDHKRTRRSGGSDDWSNLQGLCWSHHSQKTARHDGGFGNSIG
jgi:5-methylcytosine-specific restriction protein A